MLLICGNYSFPLSGIVLHSLQPAASSDASSASCGAVLLSANDEAFERRETFHVQLEDVQGRTTG